MLKNFRKNQFRNLGFTLAEVLITLAIIGVVAVLTVPTLITNNQEKGWNTAATVFEAKLEQALKVMNTQGTLAGYRTTKDFVDELSNHLKIVKVCDSDKLTDCFADKVYWDVIDISKPEQDMEIINVAEIKTSANLGQKDWGTEVIGFQLNNGMTSLIAYNPDCHQDPFSNQITGMDCVAVAYDVSGFTKPNTYTKDLRAINTSLKGECAFKINGQCYGAPFKVGNWLSYEKCQEMVDSGKYGNFACNSNIAYGDYNTPMLAAEVCGNLDNIMTNETLEKILNYLYVHKNGEKIDVSKGYSEGLVKLDEKKLNSLGLSVGDTVIGPYYKNKSWYTQIKTLYNARIYSAGGYATGFQKGYLFCKLDN